MDAVNGLRNVKANLCESLSNWDELHFSVRFSSRRKIDIQLGEFRAVDDKFRIPLEGTLEVRGL